MIQIDIVADLNMVDDLGRNVAPVAERTTLVVGDIAVAGRPGFWSWALIEEIEAEVVYFRQISSAEAAQHGDLVVVPA